MEDSQMVDTTDAADTTTKSNVSAKTNFLSCRPQFRFNANLTRRKRKIRIRNEQAISKPSFRQVPVNVTQNDARAVEAQPPFIPAGDSIKRRRDRGPGGLGGGDDSGSDSDGRMGRGTSGVEVLETRVSRRRSRIL